MERDRYIIGYLRGLFDTEGSIKKFGGTIGLAIKMRCSKCIEYFSKGVRLLGLRPRIYTWSEKGRPMHAIILLGKQNVLDFISTIKPANKKHLSRLDTYTTHP